MTQFDLIRKSISICLETDGCVGCLHENENGCIRRLFADIAEMFDSIERGGMVAWHDGLPEVSGDYIANGVDFDGRPTRFLSLLHYSAQHGAFNAHDGCDHNPETDIEVCRWAKVLPPKVIKDAE